MSVNKMNYVASWLTVTEKSRVQFRPRLQKQTSSFATWWSKPRFPCAECTAALTANYFNGFRFIVSERCAYFLNLDKHDWDNFVLMVHSTVYK